MHVSQIIIPQGISRISAAEYRDLLAGKPLPCCTPTEPHIVRSSVPTHLLDEPLEHDEQTAFVQWLRHKDIRHNATPNGGHRAAKTAKWLKAEGVSPGFPDITVWPKLGTGLPVLHIEMKRRINGRTSAEQSEWVSYLGALPGHMSCVCNGADQAIAFVRSSWDLA